MLQTRKYIVVVLRKEGGSTRGYGGCLEIHPSPHLTTPPLSLDNAIPGKPTHRWTGTHTIS